MAKIDNFSPVIKMATDTVIRPDGTLHPQVERGFKKLLSVQRPVVLAYIRQVRRRHPRATPAEIVGHLEKHYLRSVIAGGAGVGATAVVPGIGTGTSLVLSGVETAGFLGASALFSQAVTELHGIAVEDPERARALVMTMMLGTAGADMVKQFAAHAAGGPAVTSQWGPLITKSLPKTVISKMTTRLGKSFVRRFAVRQGASVVGRAVPFGIGAAIGGFGNRMLGRQVIESSRSAFGPAPEQFPPDLDLRPRVRRPLLRSTPSVESSASRALAAVPFRRRRQPRP